MRNCTKLYSAGIPNANSLAHKRKLPSFLRQVGTTQFRGNFNSVPFPFFFSILNPWLELVVRWQLCKPDITRWRSYTRRWRSLTKITIGSVAVESSSSSQSRAVMFISLETTGEFDSFHSDIKRTVTTTTLFQQSKKCLQIPKCSDQYLTSKGPFQKASAFSSRYTEALWFHKSCSTST